MDNGQKQPTLEEVYIEQNSVYNSVPVQRNYKTGRSIVTTSYRGELPSTFVLLNELNRLNFNTPIEVFYREGELNDGEISELTRINPQWITVKKITSYVKNYQDKWGNQKGWGTKVYAILESEWEENLWLDNDNFPIRNCMDLFNDQEYLEKGSLFWRDVYSVDRSEQYWSGSVMWKIFNVPYNDGEPFESGQFLLNKLKVQKQLNIMKYYTDRNEIYYSFGGDAECWRMAWQYVASKSGEQFPQLNYLSSPNVPYGFMPYGPFHKGPQNPWHKWGGGSVMVQRDRNGNELFNHRNIIKFNWGENNPYCEDITNESNYHFVINHIKSKYKVK